MFRYAVIQQGKCNVTSFGSETNGRACGPEISDNRNKQFGVFYLVSRSWANSKTEPDNHLIQRRD